MNKIIGACLGLALVFSATGNAKTSDPVKNFELNLAKNKSLVKSVAYSISHFEYDTKSQYSSLIIYPELYSDSNGMLNYTKGVGELVETEGLIIVLENKDNNSFYVYYNGMFSYMVKDDPDFEADLKSKNIGTQLYAISNYTGVNI